MMQHERRDHQKAAGTETRSDADDSARFAKQAEEPSPSLIAEFIEFIRHNKAWWLVPILLAFGLLAVAAWLSGSPLAPFIYPLF